MAIYYVAHRIAHVIVTEFGLLPKPVDDSEASLLLLWRNYVPRAACSAAATVRMQANGFIKEIQGPVGSFIADRTHSEFRSVGYEYTACDKKRVHCQPQCDYANKDF
jgi:hypothetical protein